MEKKGNEQLDIQFAKLCEKVSSHTLPRWSALPDIELYMDQVVAVLEKSLDIYNECSFDEGRIVTPSIINNYVKLKVIPAPNKKRYSKEHLAYLIIICILKQTLPIALIVTIMERQLKVKSIDTLYDSFCDIYENVLPFVHSGDFGQEVISARQPAEIGSGDDINDFILRSAILSTAGKFICEGILSMLAKSETAKD